MHAWCFATWAPMSQLLAVSVHLSRTMPARSGGGCSIDRSGRQSRHDRPGGGRTRTGLRLIFAVQVPVQFPSARANNRPHGERNRSGPQQSRGHAADRRVARNRPGSHPNNAAEQLRPDAQVQTGLCSSRRGPRPSFAVVARLASSSATLGCWLHNSIPGRPRCPLPEARF